MLVQQISSHQHQAQFALLPPFQRQHTLGQRRRQKTHRHTLLAQPALQSHRRSPRCFWRQTHTRTGGKVRP